jgi:hypothetical protein
VHVFSVVIGVVVVVVVGVAVVEVVDVVVQACVLHSFVSVLGPHPAPFPSGSATTTCIRDRDPPPHVFEQASHSSHATEQSLFG